MIESPCGPVTTTLIEVSVSVDVEIELEEAVAVDVSRAASSSVASVDCEPEMVVAPVAEADSGEAESPAAEEASLSDKSTKPIPAKMPSTCCGADWVTAAALAWEPVARWIDPT
jgi:hypothetical protein